MKILLLEDDFTLSKEIITFFTSKSFDCTPFYDGYLLLKKYKALEYDLISHSLKTNHDLLVFVQKWYWKSV
ncbi:response regulator [Flavobacterium sp.]|uniref:response regulator n=1 Tax=Flavobacterium sp. TaxID=239 RepID=UPI003C57913A